MKRKGLFLSFFLVFLVLLLYISDAFGLFEINSSSPLEADLAKWQIIVNSSDISNNGGTFLIPEVHWERNENTMEGKAAPGSKAYFEILIDPRGSEVSLSYQLYLDFLNLSNESIRIISVKNKNNEVLEPNEEGKYQGLILLSSIKNNEWEKIRVDFKWENDENNNEKDSKYVGKVNQFLDIPITLRFSQYIE